MDNCCFLKNIHKRTGGLGRPAHLHNQLKLDFNPPPPLPGKRFRFIRASSLLVQGNGSIPDKTLLEDAISKLSRNSWF
jgi:hypothetical protein